VLASGMRLDGSAVAPGTGCRLACTPCSAGLAALNGMQAAVDLAQRGRHVAAQDLAGLGHAHLLAAAVEQGRTQLVLQLLDLVRQRRLRDVQALRRAGEVQRLGDGVEVAEVAQFHGGVAAALVPRGGLG
jgi:hypothetical protein